MKEITVVGAVLIKDGKILIAKRKQTAYLPGKWEFPGGKIEAGETPEKCLERELFEELSIITKTAEFINENIHDYGDRKIRLLCYFSEWVSGEFVLIDHDEIAWVLPEKLLSYDIADADIPAALKVAEITKNLI